MPFPGVKKEYKEARIICRLCLVKDSTYSDIFDEKTAILHVLENLIGIQISPQDNWPKTLCMSCTEKIRAFQELIKVARENERSLREIFGDYQIQDYQEEKINQPERKFSGNSVKDEGSDAGANEGFNFDESECSDSKEEVLEELPRRITRGSCKNILKVEVKPSRSTRTGRESKIPKKRGRKPKEAEKMIPLHEKEDTDCSKEAEHPEEDVEERTKSTKDRKSRDEKIDEEIHAFFKMECVLCNIPFPRFADVQVHFRKEHKRRGYVVCCGKKLNRPMKLHEHMNVHVNPTKHQCPVCEKWYKTHDSMLMHRKLQHTPVEERKFFCKKCPKRFALAHALTAHMITHMPAEEKKHVCSTCGQAFALATILVQHVRRVHENAHVQVCEICAKVFRCKNIFEKHMLEHNNQLKPTIPCTVCGKMFTYLVAMQRHRRRHNTSGSLECPICQRVAANQQALQEHIKNNHRERKSFQCGLCGRNFRSRISLKEHMATHTGQVLYECNYCSKQFNSNANYFHHKKNAHPAEHKAEREKRLAQQVFLKPEVKAD